MTLPECCFRAFRTASERFHEYCPSWNSSLINPHKLAIFNKEVALECLHESNSIERSIFERCMTAERILTIPVTYSPGTINYRIYTGAAYESTAYVCLREALKNDPTSEYWIGISVVAVLSVIMYIKMMQINQTKE